MKEDCIGHAGGIGVVSEKLQTFLSTWYGRVGQVMATALRMQGPGALTF